MSPCCDHEIFHLAFWSFALYGLGMACNYDELYGTTENALGEPTQVFVDFFQDHSKTQDGCRVRVLDIGCGQGRDALFIARLGHHVTGVDLSANGIRDLTQSAALEGLAVQGVVADITGFTPEGQFDVVLIDRTLHMLDEAPRLAVLSRLLDHVSDNGWLLIADERANMAGIKSVLQTHRATWKVTLDKGGDYFLQRKTA